MIEASPTDPSRRRAPDIRPAQIIDAALEVFGERGLAGARLDDIARRAGIAKGTIYLYFPNKEALFRDVIRQTLVARLEVAERDLAASTDVTAADQLRHYMRTWWAFLRTPAFQTVYHLVVGELHQFPDVAEFYARDVVARGNTLLGGVVARGIARGEFRNGDPRVIARMIAALFTSAAIWTTNPILSVCVCPASSGPDEMLDQLTDFVFHALRPDAATAAPLTGVSTQ